MGSTSKAETKEIRLPEFMKNNEKRNKYRTNPVERKHRQTPFEAAQSNK